MSDPEQRGAVQCAACASVNDVRVFAISVGGELLRLQVPLCTNHGTIYLLKVGEILGRLLREAKPGE